MNTQEFNTLASDSSKTFRLEAFSFTFQFGLNVFFNDYDDLMEIIGESEIEFWSLEVQADSVEIEVKSFKELQQVLAVYEDEPSNAEQLVYLAQIVSEGYATWENARDWHEDNYFSEDMNDYDFGHYLMHDVSCIEIPEVLQGYISYEAYGRDAKINDFVTIGNSIYNNH